MVKEMDLTGQDSVDDLPLNYFAGVSSVLDFIRGTAAALAGKSILLIPSTSVDKKTSRIVPQLTGNVVIPMSDVTYVVSEYGAVNLFGKNLQERATAMITLAHPDFREELFDQARRLGLLTMGSRLGESLRRVYPAGLEETRTIGNQSVKFRPAKPVDERRIQEHFYNLDKKDVFSRFFQNKTCFFRDDIEGMCEIDYVKNLTILAVTGEFGFGEVIGIGAYMLEADSNLAEAAFSVSRPWQEKRIAATILRKLAQAAMENGIAGLVAYTEPANTAMRKLFAPLPYSIKTWRDADLLILTCRFDAAAKPPEFRPG